MFVVVVVVVVVILNCELELLQNRINGNEKQQQSTAVLNTNTAIVEKRLFAIRIV